jgi:hypothetical protein
MEKKEWLIREDGTILERLVRERELEAEHSIIDTLTTEVVRSARNVIQLPDWGSAHANIGPGDILWSVPIQRIPLKAKFRLVNQALVPMFGSTSDLEMPMVWEAPPEIRLVFVVRTECSEEYATIGGNWLFAFGQNRNAYRLPLPNLYDDCSICMGEFAQQYDTASECLTASLQQFNKSQWNSDLMPATEKSQKFFRFKPTDETFETLPVDAGDWTSLCAKVSTAVMDRIIL